MTLEECAADVGIGFGTWFSKRRVRLGRQVSLGPHCLIGACSIGEGTLVGSNIDILSGRYQHSVNAHERSADDRARKYSMIPIGKNAWIGNRSVIMAGIGDHTVIGAGSVVVRSIPPDSLAVGNPAVVKRKLGSPAEDSRMTFDHDGEHQGSVLTDQAAL